MTRASTAALFVCVALPPAPCAAQDLTPRAYVPTPVSSNAVIATYAHSSGDVLFDPTLPVADATGTIHTPVLGFYRSFDFFGRSANASGGLPFAVGDLRGKLSGVDREIHRAGVADLGVRLSVNLRGGPALKPAAFVKAGFPRSVLGASVKISMPTGQYDPTRLINLGANRWGFKPELGYMRRVGAVVLDAYAGFWLFTANNDYAASAPGVQGSRRTQDPIGALEFHLSYNVTPRLWISGDVNYWRGGRTSVNGVKNAETLQATSRVGVTTSFPVGRRQSLKVSYSDGATVRIGGDFRIVSVGWQYSWFGLPFRRA